TRFVSELKCQADASSATEWRAFWQQRMLNKVFTKSVTKVWPCVSKGRAIEEDILSEERWDRLPSAPRHEVSVTEATLDLAVADRFSGRGGDRAAGRYQHRMAGGNVPLHGRGKPRVDVRLASRNRTEFK